MQKKLMMLPLFLVLLLSVGFGHAQATGNVDNLCGSISDDLNAAGGCIDDNDLEDTITSSAGLFVLEGGDKSGLLMLFVVIGVLVGIVTAAVIKTKLAVRK